MAFPENAAELPLKFSAAQAIPRRFGRYSLFSGCLSWVVLVFSRPCNSGFNLTREDDALAPRIAHLLSLKKMWLVGRRWRKISTKLRMSVYRFACYNALMNRQLSDRRKQA